MLSPIEEIVALRRKVEDLEEENRRLKGLLRPDGDAPSRALLGLQPQEWLLLRVLMAASPNAICYERAAAALKSNAGDPLKVVAQRLFTLRKKMGAHGVVIRSVRGDIIFIDSANKAKVEALLDRR